MFRAVIPRRRTAEARVISQANPCGVPAEPSASVCGVLFIYPFSTTSQLCRSNLIKRDQRDVTYFFTSLFNAQHVSDVNTSILRSLRLIC